MPKKFVYLTLHENGGVVNAKFISFFIDSFLKKLLEDLKI
jgi:hypothetical protein